ncbi:STAS domain-containing protein [Streptomyces sp. NPDC101237]|uniref:STAS domain-containing protein n=1 Tax=Streptomyces sp. NPDC101237 TaxID=3366139 RepID=UPI003820C0A6
MNSVSGGEERPPEPGTAPGGTLPRLVQREQGGAWVVAAVGAFDLNSTPTLAAALEAGARTHARVVLDATGLTFADSTVLNLLLHFHRTAVLRVAGPAPQLARVLELTGADAVLDVRPTLEEALAD